ncbi:MAG: hypothetical protein M3527_04745, partial [Actinomycetota bacterium]|nr:hypothetical protein [Actinomycetota bacterium]
MALSAAIAVLVAALASAPGSGAQEPGDELRFEATSTYTVDPVASVIHVAVDVALTNEAAPEYGTSSIRNFYWPEVGLPVLAEAANLAAARFDGSPLGVRVEAVDHPAIAFAVVDLEPDLQYRDTQGFRLTYDLPDQPPRSDRITRANPGYVSVLPLVVGDPGLANVKVVVPDGYEVEVLGTSTLNPERQTGQTSWNATAIDDPDGWDASLTARNGDALTEVVVDMRGQDIAVRSWPGDGEWSDFVTRYVREGLPVLADLIGRPWPLDDTLRIEETISPYLYLYSGWYRPDDGLIEIGDELEAIVVLHEMAHAWFDSGLFAERWINEAFAEEFAARTLERLGEPLEQPDPVVAGDPGAIRLNDWSTPLLSASISEDQERFGYNVSLLLARILSDEIGMEGLARVVAAADDDAIAYRGDPEAEQWDRPTDWRRLLDLLEEVGGSQQAGALFAANVVAGAEELSLVQRTESRRAYDELEA